MVHISSKHAHASRHRQARGNVTPRKGSKPRPQKWHRSEHRDQARERASKVHSISLNAGPLTCDLSRSGLSTAGTGAAGRQKGTPITQGQQQKQLPRKPGKHAVNTVHTREAQTLPWRMEKGSPQDTESRAGQGDA